MKGLSKTRWVERHECYESYFEMYESIALTFEAILNPDDHTSLYAETSDDSDQAEIENFNWDSDTRTKAQADYANSSTCYQFYHGNVCTRACKTFGYQTSAAKSRYLQSLQTC